MKKFKWFNLQLFADGGASAGDGSGVGEGAATGDNAAVDAGQQRLLELGVPADKIRKRAKKTANKLPGSAETTAATPEKQEALQETQQDAAADTQTEETKTDASARMSWDEIMADPEYNKQMQAVVQSRLKSAKAAEEALEKLTPSLELLARKHNLDIENMDYDALSKAISDNSDYYEDKALEMGVPVDIAMKLDKEERDSARQKREEARTLEQQKIQQHISKLEQQGEKMKEVFPSFDLKAELQNPAFARMTSPNVGISVEDAYYAIHRNEIQTAAMQATAMTTAQKISNSIQSGQRRPSENGTSGQAASVTTFDYSKASREQRESLKRRIREAAARGEKVYPGS